MKIATKALKSSVLFLVLGLSLGSFCAENAFGQNGRNRAKNAVKNKVRNHATTQGKNRARDVYQSQGKNIVKQKAIQNGVTKQQVLNNSTKAKNWAKNSIKNRTQNQTNNWLQNNGRDFAKKQIKGKTVGLAKDKAKDIYRNHGKQIVKNYAQQNGYTKQQVLNHQNQVKNRLKHGIKSRAKNAVQNHGKDYAKNRLQQYGKQQVRNHVKDKVKGRVGDYVSHRKQWYWHQGHTFGSSSWKQLFGRASYLRSHRACQWNFQQWQQCFPSQCGWWYGYCGTDFYFDPSCTTSFDWTCYQVPVALVGVVKNADVRWNLGLKCILIPGKGLGVEEVTAGSPAELAGLEPGMIILTANGIPIVDEVAFPSAIDSSGGALELEVQVSATEVATTTVQMQPMQLINF